MTLDVRFVHRCVRRTVAAHRFRLLKVDVEVILPRDSDLERNA